MELDFSIENIHNNIHFISSKLNNSEMISNEFQQENFL